jgi:hypothetical protein
MVVSLPGLQVIAGSVKDQSVVLEWAGIEVNLKNLMDEWDRGNPAVPVRRPIP